MAYFYWPDTTVLLTRFLSPDGVGEIEDFMPVGRAAAVSFPRTWVRESTSSKSRDEE